MKSLHTRLDPVKEEVVEVTRLWGRGRAMDTFSVRDWIGFDRWLYETTGVKEFGMRPVMGFDTPAQLLNQTLDKFMVAIQNLAIENDNLKQENRELKEAMTPRTEVFLEKLATLNDALEPKIARQLPLTNRDIGETDDIRTNHHRPVSRVRDKVRVAQKPGHATARPLSFLPEAPEEDHASF